MSVLQTTIHMQVSGYNCASYIVYFCVFIVFPHFQSMCNRRGSTNLTSAQQTAIFNGHVQGHTHQQLAASLTSARALSQSFLRGGSLREES